MKDFIIVTVVAFLIVGITIVSSFVFLPTTAHMEPKNIPVKYYNEKAMLMCDTVENVSKLKYKHVYDFKVEGNKFYAIYADDGLGEKN